MERTRTSCMLLLSQERSLVVRFFFSIVSLLTVSNATTTASAATLYSQTTPVDPTASFTSWNSPNIQKLADNFVVDGYGTYTVRSLRVIGIDGTTALQPDVSFDDVRDDFRVVFLSDNMDRPGVPLDGGDFSISPATIRRPTGGSLLNGVGTPAEFFLDLRSGITLERGTEYWISVSNDADPTGGWAWARAVGVFDQVLAATNDEIESGPWRTHASGGMWFELNDEFIPEPNTVSLCLLGLTIAHMRRR